MKGWGGRIYKIYKNIKGKHFPIKNINYNMIVDTEIMDIIYNWMNASDNDIVKAKKIIMPEDDPNNISFIVTSHPNINNKKEIYIEWYDIDVYQSNINICNITINGFNRKAIYTFN